MADLNLLDFYKDCALVLMSLHRAFPRKTDLFVEDLIGPDEVDEFGLHTKRHEACLGAMLWLADEGYLRYASTVRQGGVDQAVLTAKALVELTRVRPQLNTDLEMEPVSEFEVQQRLTMVEHMRRAVKSQSSEQLVQVMMDFFQPV